jgi:hypothetical protein
MANTNIFLRLWNWVNRLPLPRLRLVGIGINLALVTINMAIAGEPR